MQLEQYILAAPNNGFNVIPPLEAKHCIFASSLSLVIQSTLLNLRTSTETQRSHFCDYFNATRHRPPGHYICPAGPMEAYSQHKAATLPPACGCTNCGLQFYLETDRYNCFIHTKPSNAVYNGLTSIFDIHGFHTNYLVAKALGQHPKAFLAVLSFCCQRIGSFIHAVKASDQLLHFLRCCSRQKHMRWLIESEKAVSDWLTIILPNTTEFKPKATVAPSNAIECCSEITDVICSNLYRHKLLSEFLPSWARSRANTVTFPRMISGLGCRKPFRRRELFWSGCHVPYELHRALS